MSQEIPRRRQRRRSTSLDYLRCPSSVLLISTCLLLLISSGSLIGSAAHSISNTQETSAPVFDPTPYKSVYEIIQHHPDLREFANLCELKGVKEIVSVAATGLTVFAPIDRSLGELVAKTQAASASASARGQINLVDLAKQHIVQGFVVPDESLKYPFQFVSYAQMSPLYLNQVKSTSSSAYVQHFVNNAKILQTHLIPIDAEQYQTLHLIDTPIEYSFALKRTQLKQPQMLNSGSPISGGSPVQTGAAMSALARRASSQQFAYLKRPLSFDDLTTSGSDENPLLDFYERFADLSSNQPLDVDLYKARSLTGSEQQQRLALDARQLGLDELLSTAKGDSLFKGRLYALNESNSLNTYFLPVQSDELTKLLRGKDLDYRRMVLEAHIVPNEVLFTRTMSLGSPHASQLAGLSQQLVELSLAKSLPAQVIGQDQETSQQLASKRMLTTPLLVQARTRSSSSTSGPVEHKLRNGLTSAEILVANIPLSNGVLHLIKRPLVDVSQTNLMDYLNDDNNQLSQLVRSSGSLTASTDGEADIAAATSGDAPIQVVRFRELLLRDRKLLSTFATDTNLTLLVPSDDAFARLRYDLRALVMGDEAMIPSHWDASYRQDVIAQLLKRHIILHQTITSDLLASGEPLEATSQTGKTLKFSREQLGSGRIQVECAGDSAKARILHKDLIGSNGVMHLIERVLGEEQETMHSLLESLVLRNKLEPTAPGLQVEPEVASSFVSAQSELGELVEASLKQVSSSMHQDNALVSSPEVDDTSSTDRAAGRTAQTRRNSAELDMISKTIEQYLGDLSANSNQKYLQLATSVNISHELARLTAAQHMDDDWADRFKSPDRMFTYFVPSDLAWLRAQQTQPELYRPLMHFLQARALERTGSASSVLSPSESSVVVSTMQPTTTVGRHRVLSESSFRLRQILERHLLENRKLSATQLNHLDSLRTIGAHLELIQSSPQSTLLGAGSEPQQLSTGNQLTKVFSAALHSITGTVAAAASAATSSQSHNPPPNMKVLKFSDSVQANIMQINEASNGYVYILDNVFLLPEDTKHIVQTSSSPTMSSLLGAHNSALLDYISVLAAGGSFAQYSILALIGTLSLAIVLMLVFALVLVVARRRKQNKLNRHHQLESGLTSGSSNASNSGSTSTTKSL